MNFLDQSVGIGYNLIAALMARRAAREAAVGKLRDLGSRYGLDSISKRASPDEVNAFYKSSRSNPAAISPNPAPPAQSRTIPPKPAPHPATSVVAI